MGYLYADTMVDRVRSALGNPDELLVSEDLILQFLNESLIRITAKPEFTEFCHTENISTTAGVADYNMTATDILFIENVVNTTTKFDLKQINETDYDLWVSSTGVQGNPTHYYKNDIVGDVGDTAQMRFFPTPSGTYTLRVRYAVRPPLLVTDPAANKSCLSSLWDPALIYGAIALGWVHLTEPEKAQAAASLAAGSAAEAMKLEYHPTEVPAQTGRTFKAGIG